jgi:hypothetical protein
MLWFPFPDVALTWTIQLCLRRFANGEPPSEWSMAVLPRLACHRRLPDQGILLGWSCVFPCSACDAFGAVCVLHIVIFMMLTYTQRSQSFIEVAFICEFISLDNY